MKHINLDLGSYQLLVGAIKLALVSTRKNFVGLKLTWRGESCHNSIDFESVLWTLYDGNFKNHKSWTSFLRGVEYKDKIKKQLQVYVRISSKSNVEVGVDNKTKCFNGENEKFLECIETMINQHSPSYQDYFNWFLSNLFFETSSSKVDCSADEKMEFIQWEQQYSVSYSPKANAVLWQAFYGNLLELAENFPLALKKADVLDKLNQFIQKSINYVTVNLSEKERETICTHDDFVKRGTLINYQEDNIKKYIELCNEAGAIFWSLIIKALKPTETITTIYKKGTHIMLQYEILTSSPILSKVYAACLDDYMLDAKKASDCKVLEKCSVGEIYQYLSFLCTLKNDMLEERSSCSNDIEQAEYDNRTRQLKAFFFEPFFTAVNNPAVQSVLFTTQCQDILADIKEIYSAFTYRLQIFSKLPNDDTVQEEFPTQIPMVRTDLLNADIIHRFFSADGKTNNGVTFQKYLYSTKKREFVFRRGETADFGSIMSILPKKDIDKFIPPSKEGLTAAVENNHLYVICDTNSSIAAFLILHEVNPNIPYGQTIRNELVNQSYSKNIALSSCSVFNTIVVAEDWRGFGFMRMLMAFACQKGIYEQKQYIVATVSPENEFSYRNFEQFGFKSVSQITYHFDNEDSTSRDFMMLEI